MSVMPKTSAQATSANPSRSLPYAASSRFMPRHPYLASTFFSCSPYCGLALMAFAQPISLAFST